MADVYDALLFVRETSVARANPTGRRPPIALTTAPAPANLDFEEGESGDWPTGWTGPSGIAGTEWETQLTRADAVDGAQAVVIRRAAGGGYGETYGELRQRVDATPWRGKRITLRASVRIELPTPSSRGYLWLQTGPRNVPAFYENMEERPITAPEWREYEITADVPEDANAIAFGFAFVGAGQAWLDKVSLGAGAGPKP